MFENIANFDTLLIKLSFEDYYILPDLCIMQL